MASKRPKFHYPANIKLQYSPLIEAWITIQWAVQQEHNSPFGVDPGFNKAVFKFAELVKPRFPEVKPLDVSQIPEVIAYRPRVQFLRKESDWPVLQLGPGLATVNFTDPYSWRDFKTTIAWVRPKLLKAYEDHELKTTTLSLKYRSAFPCDYKQKPLLEFLEANLNTSVKLPNYIPGEACEECRPATFDQNISFNLSYPVGKGIVRIVTGTKRVVNPQTGETENPPHVISELEVLSDDKSAPSLTDSEQFTSWLDAAHAVLHDWFFSLVEGPLLEEFKKIKSE